MENKIKILIYNLDKSGVNYFRSLAPAMQLERNHADDFDIEINSEIDFKAPNLIDILKQYDIIHYHRQFAENVPTMLKIKNALKERGTKFIMDIDDYWHLHRKHPFYQMAIQNKMHLDTIDNLKMADYVTTTSELFVEEIKKITGKDNVIAIYNSVDPTWMKQFQNNWQADKNGKVRITYMAGSSHAGDVEQLETVINWLNTDSETKDKFRINLCGYDTEGTTTEVKLNEEFISELQQKGLWNNELIKEINKSKGNIDMINKLSTNLKNKYRGKLFLTNQRSINSEESVYLNYEKIFTDNYKIIKNQDYIKWLKNYERNVKYYGDEDNYKRVWTQKANIYAEMLDDTDIVLAPLEDNTFNRLKSNLKQVECWSRKLPIVCSDIPPYNVDGVHMKNCILIPADKNAHKYWKKELKKLILDADLRKQLGEQLYEDFHEKYHLTTQTKKRADFYKNILRKE